jgi:uncharacterized protein (TIRG00374 family)
VWIWEKELWPNRKRCRKNNAFCSSRGQVEKKCKTMKTMKTIKKMKKILYKSFIILSSAIILVILLFFTNGFEELAGMLANLNIFWISAAVASMFVYWFMEALMIQLITRVIHHRQRMIDSLKVTMVGSFFNSITPFALGGQPMQIYVMAKDGVKTGHGVLLFIIKSALYQIVIMAYSLAAVITRGAFFTARIPHFLVIYLIGFLGNIFMIIFDVLFLFNSEAACRLIMFFAGLLKRLRLIKDTEKFGARIKKEASCFTDGVLLLKGRTAVAVVVVIIQAVQLAIFFAITYFIYLAVGGRGAGLWDMVAAQAVITMTTFIFPSPGSTGGAEGLSYLFFRTFFHSGIVIPVILVWRIITYYFNIIFGGIVSVLAPEKPLEKAGIN